MIAIITSADCVAGNTIKQQLLSLADWKEQDEFEGYPVYHFGVFSLYTLEQQHIRAEHLDEQIPAELFLFATEHASKAGKNALAVHSIGNWGPAEFGGKAKTLVSSPAVLLRKALQLIEEKAKDLPYEIIQEATHHGPFLNKPALFLEIGCDDTAKKDKKAGKVIAETLLALDTPYDTQQNKELISVVGVGGLHHAPNFRSIQFKHNYVVAHVCPKYALSQLTAPLIKEAMEKSIPTASVVLLDWKGLGSEKDAVVAMLNKEQIPWKRIKDVKREDNL